MVVVRKNHGRDVASLWRSRRCCVLDEQGIHRSGGEYRPPGVSF